VGVFTCKYRNSVEKDWGCIMAKKAFGGKKAAPFVKGGGRKKSSTKTARGLKKK
jgi:hypothetical protein